jgi:antitoxin PrlF
MNLESSTLTSKGQTTIPAAIRKALALSAGDEIVFQIEDDHAIIRRARPLDVEYLRAVQASFSSEWDSPEDDEAYRDL